LGAYQEVSGHQHVPQLIGLLDEATAPTARTKHVLPVDDTQQLMSQLEIVEENGSLNADLSFKEVDEMYVPNAN